MRSRRKSATAALFLLGFFAAACASVEPTGEMTAAKTSTIEFTPLPLAVELDNPYRGWVAYSRPADAPAPVEFDSVSILIDWAQLEPVEGQYDWGPLERAVETQARESLSARLYLMPDPYWGLPGRPDWIDQEFPPIWCGEEDPDCQSGERGWAHPPYWNKNFQKKAERFLRAFAEHFQSRFDYVDVRCYGIYGEWDADHRGAFPWAELGFAKSSTLHAWIDLYRRAFAGSSISLAINLPAYPKASSAYLEESGIGYALESGFAIRYDGFRPSPPVRYVRKAIDQKWEDRFVISEPGYRSTHGQTNEQIACGWCPDQAESVFNEMLAAHSNYASLGVEPHQWPEFTKHHQDLIAKGQRFLGYRIAIRKARLPKTIPVRHSVLVNRAFDLELELEWSNFGVGRLYRPAKLWASLSDSSGEVIWEGPDQCDDVDVGELIHGGPAPLTEPTNEASQETNWISEARVVSTTSHFDLPSELPAGSYELSVQLRVEGRSIALGQSGGRADRRYAIGSVQVTRSPFSWRNLFPGADSSGDSEDAIAASCRPATQTGAP